MPGFKEVHRTSDMAVLPLIRESHITLQTIAVRHNCDKGYWELGHRLTVQGWPQGIARDRSACDVVRIGSNTHWTEWKVP